MMKLLFVRGNQRHVNEMHINNVIAFSEVAEVAFWGPGYVSSEELKKGVCSHWKETGGYDAVILDFNVAMLHSACLNIEMAYHWNRYFEGTVSIFEMIRYADSIVNDIGELNVPKILYYYFDTYTFREEWLSVFNLVKSKDFYFWMNGEEFCPEIDEQAYVHKVMHASNRYRNFCLKNVDRIISMSYSSVVRTEFCNRPISKRKYDISVPGNLDRLTYPERFLIYNEVKTLNFKVYDAYSRDAGYGNGDSRIENKDYNSINDKCIDMLLNENCCYINSKTKMSTLSKWRELFDKGLRCTKMVYSDGGCAKQLVRKYAEIPVRGSLLLCQKIAPLEPYGFVEWENMVTVDENNLEERCRYLLLHPREMQNIALQGQKMVIEKHSATEQTKLIIRAIKKIKDGTFKGSRWMRGTFCVQNNFNQFIEI